MNDFESLVATVEDDKQSSYRRRQALTDLLANHQGNKRSYEAFRTVTQGDDSFLVREMVSAVKDVKAPGLLPIMRDLLKVGDDYTKRDVIQVLGKNGGAEDLRILEAYCSDKSYSVSYAAKQAVANLEKKLAEIPEPDVQEIEESKEAETIVDEETVLQPEENKAVLESPETTEEIEEKSEDESKTEPEAFPELEKTAEPSTEEVSEIMQETTGIDSDLLNEKRGSLHDNSIFKDKQLVDVHRHYEDQSEFTFSEVAPALFSESKGFDNPQLKKFFGVQIQSVMSLYKQLKECQKQLPEKEKKLSECRRKLTMLEADKADDIEISKSTVVERSKKSKDLEWEIKKIKLDLKDLDEENNKFFISLLNSFSEDRQVEIDNKKKDLEKNLDKLKKKLSESDVELNEDQTEVEALKKPLIALEQELKNCENDRDSCLKRLMSAEQEINAAYLKVITESYDVEDHLSFLNEKSVIAKSIVTKLKLLVEKLSLTKAELSRLEESLKDLDSNSYASTKTLGDSLEKSFRTVRTSAKEKVSVSANVNFKEESSFFGGYSNASGSAQGKGSATMRYEISETKWEPVASLEENITKFRGQYEKLGEISTASSILRGKITSQENQLRQYIDYLRMMIEGTDS